MNSERRSKGRLEFVLPLKIRCSNEGKTYHFKTVARNISAGGLCAYAPRAMRVGERISMRVRFARPAGKTADAPEISVRGRVIRVEARPTGLCLFAVSFLLRCK